MLPARDAVRAHFEDVFARDMTHQVDIAVVTEDAIGYSVRCAYRRRHEGRLRGHRRAPRRAHRAGGRGPSVGLVR